VDGFSWLRIETVAGSSSVRIVLHVVGSVSVKRHSAPAVNSYSWLRGGEFFRLRSLSRTSPRFVELEASLSCSQESVTGIYPEPDESKVLQMYFCKIHFYVILLSTPRSSVWPLYVRLSNQNCVCISHFSYARYSVCSITVNSLKQIKVVATSLRRCCASVKLEKPVLLFSPSDIFHCTRFELRVANIREMNTALP
jgi:hypothetical protein